MARVEKYTAGVVSYHLRHNTRESPKPPINIEIDSERCYLNYTLSSHGEIAKECYSYYKQRISEVYLYGNKAVNTMAQWVITAPADLSKEGESAFFEAAHNYCNSLYGERNCVQSVVHYDEGVRNSNGDIIAGRPHLHYSFIPIVKNKRFMKPNAHGNITESAKYKEKVCANDLLNKKHLQNWHIDFQNYLDRRGIKCSVLNGATAEGNRTVEQLKKETKLRELEKENELLKEQVKDLKKAHEITASPWSDSSRSGWSKGAKQSWTQEQEKEY